MKKMSLFIMTLLFICSFSIAGAADCTRNYISSVLKTTGGSYGSSVAVNQTNTEVYMQSYNSIFFSADRGATWNFGGAGVAYDWTGIGTTGEPALFVTSQGTILASRLGTGKLHRLTGSATSWSRTEELDFEDTTNGRFWKMDESPNNILYLGEYTDETDNANIWRSTDDGLNWTQIYDGDGLAAASADYRHVHFVEVDEHHDTAGQYHVYAAVGDGAGKQAILKCTNPEDVTPIWNEIYTADCWGQPISIICTPSYRVFGSDCGEAGETNSIYRTTDDSAFTEELTLDAEFVWSMTEDSRGVIYAGTLRGTDGTVNVAMYVSYDEGDTWCKVYNAGDYTDTDGDWKGFEWMSRNWDTDGYGYFVLHESGLAEVYRFRGFSTWEIGPSGKDFTTINGAIAGAMVGRYDTLEIYPDVYNEDEITPYENMTILGSTKDPSQHVIRSLTGASKMTVECDSTNVVYRNVEFRGNASSKFGWNFGLFDFSTNGIRSEFYNCNFQNCDGNNWSTFRCNATDLEIIIEGCRAESTNFTDASSRGFIRGSTDSFSKIAIRRSVFYLNTGGTGLMTLDQSTAATDSVIITHNRFIENDTNTSTAIGVIHVHSNTGAAAPIIEHNVFYQNTQSGDANDGQFSFGGDGSSDAIKYCIFYGDGTTLANSNAASSTESALYCTAYNNGGSNVITADSKTACLTLDPIFSNTDRLNDMSGFVATNKYTADGTTSPFRTADYNYMGWKQCDFADWNMRNSLGMNELMKSFRIR